MPPYDDITQTGPQNWRDLQKVNNNSIPDEYWKLSDRERLVYRRNFLKNLSPKEYLTERDVPEGFGNSKYDKDVPNYALNDLEDWRAREQSGLSKIANGVIKGAITTGTTYVNVLAGVPVGIITAAAEGRLSGLWDNVVTNATKDITDWSEEAIPNYYTNTQRESAWYSPENLFSANFLGDKLIKNFGFTAGAGLGMKTISKIPKLLPKLAKNKNIAREINTAETSFVGAVGEGSLEAFNGTTEWAEQNRNIIESERSRSMDALNQKYSKLEESLRQDYGNSEMFGPLMRSLMSDYQSEANQINGIANQKIEALQKQIDTQGNLILAGNIPILWGSNLLTLGKMIARGYGATKDASSKYIRKAASDSGRDIYESTLTSARQAARYAKTPLLEGIEEMNQTVVSTAAKNRAQDYYSMSIDPDATDATKSYIGYLFDAFGKTYSNIDNYEEFVIGMLSSGISDIVVGQGKALNEERKNINNAVKRANDAINNFNNRVILQNINRQQVLEDRKLDAALRNDKKDFKDSEFGQIASTVIAFSQIGKIEDLKAMLTENLSGLTDAELDNLADELQPENTQEPNFFKAMTYAQRRDYLKKQNDAYEKTINDYNKIREEIIEQSGSMFSPEQQAELIFYRLRANNSQDRINSINEDIKESILNTNVSFWSKSLVNVLNLPNRALSKDDIVNAVENFNGSDDKLIEIFKNYNIGKLISDRKELSKDIKKYNELVLDFIANPQKFEQKNSFIKRKVLDGVNAIKVKKIVPEFNNIRTFTEFSKKLSSVDKDLQDKVLNELIKQGNREAKQFKSKTNFSKYALKFLSESNEDEDIIIRASDLISDAIDKESVESASNLNNPLYSRENNNDLSDNEYKSLFNLIGDVVNHSNKEAAEPITKESPIEKNEEKKSKEDESSKETFKRVIDETAGEVEDYEGEENVLEDDEPQKESSLTRDTDNNSSLNGTEQINTRVLGTPLTSDQCHDTTKDINTTEESKIKDEKTQPSKDVVTLGFSDIDTKATIVNEKGEEVKNPYVGIPVIDQKDKDGNPTKAATELTPLYNRLKELGAFDNINNGVVKIGSQIKFAIDPTVNGEHNINGNIVNYTESPVLLYVGDKCVGSLTNETANRIGIRQKLEEEFANSSNDSIHISNRYYMLADEIWAGRIKFEKHSSVITNEKLNSIKERMSNSTLSADEVVPIITIFDPNANAFVQGTTEEYRLGRQVSNIFDDMFYKGSVVLLVPTGAYNSQSAIQPDHAFMPVRLENIRVKDISQDSKTRKELRGLIEKIFVKDQTQGGLNSIIGDIKKLITYNYHVSPTENIEVHIDPCTPRRDDNGNIIYYPNGIAEVTPITNHSYFSTHNINPNDGKFTYIRIRYKIGNNDVREFICPTHNGNVLNTSAFTSERIKEQADAIERVFVEDLNSFVNIDKNKLVNGDYIQKLIDDKILRTNVEDFKIYGNSFSMDGIIHDSQETSIQAEEAQSEQTSQETQQNNTGLEMMPVTREDLGMFRKESLRTKSNIIDIDKEVDLITKMLPQLNRENAFEIVKTLIDVNDSDEKAMGQFFRGIIKLSELAESGTAYHEAYHLVFNMILKPKERESLLKEYSKRYSKLTEIELEEQMAEDFRDYVMTREDVGVEKGILAWFKRLADLVKAIFDGRYYFESVASKIWRSKYSNRELIPTENIRNQEEKYTNEMQQIKDQAIVNGTFMKAPNGNPTNLNERQWLQVRTKAFKDWFGNWEKGLYINQDNTSFYRGQFDKPLIDNNGNLILHGKTDSLYKKAGYKIDKGVSVTRNSSDAYEYGEGQLETRINLAMDNSMDESEHNAIIDNGYYIIQFKDSISNEEIKEAGESKLIGDVTVPKGSYVIEHYVQGELVETIGEINNTDASKVVDENGEPLVVYHGSRESFTEFRLDTKNRGSLTDIIKKGIYFSNERIAKQYASSKEKEDFYKLQEYGESGYSFEEVAQAFGFNPRKEEELEAASKYLMNLENLYGKFKNNLYCVFLNIKNPVEYNLNGKTIGSLTNNQKNSINNSEGAILYDVDETTGRYRVDVTFPKMFVGTDYIVFSPNQIKSATDNIGTFSKENDDIRYKKASMSDELNAIQSVFEKRSQPDRGFDIGTYTATSNGRPVIKTNSIKELIVKEKGQYFLNMGVKFDKYNPNLSNSEKKIYSTSFIAGRSPLEVFNSITKNLGINNLLLIKHDTNYVDRNGNPVYRYEIIETTPFGTMYEVDELPLSSIKEEYTKTPEELYEEQSDPLDKIKQCDY